MVSTDRIDCDGTLRVRLALTATPDIVSNPTDIALVLDRSGSMAGDPLAAMKLGAKTFIDIIAEATGGAPSGEIGSGSRIGIVSFAATATADTALITSVDALKDAVDALSAGGNTNHADAFSTAAGLFEPASTNAKVIVMFTDGNTTAGAPPAPVAAAARAQGIIIYCIGLVGSDGVDVSALNEWATDPDATHVAVTPDAADLEELFAQLAQNISKAGATNIVIHETLNPDFVITSIQSPSKGTATMLTRMTGDVNQLQSGINMALRLFLRSPFIVFGAMIVAFTIDVPSAGVFAGAIALLSVAVFAVMLVCMPLYKRSQEKLDAVTLSARENLAGARVLRAFCKEEDERRLFSERNGALTASQKFVGRLGALTNPLTYVILNLAVILLLRVGALRVDSDRLTQGNVIALYNLMTQILVELIKLANLIVTVSRAAACGSRIESVLSMNSSLELFPEGEKEGGRVETNAKNGA